MRHGLTVQKVPPTGGQHYLSIGVRIPKGRTSRWSQLLMHDLTVYSRRQPISGVYGDPCNVILQPAVLSGRCFDVKRARPCRKHKSAILVRSVGPLPLCGQPLTAIHIPSFLSTADTLELPARINPCPCRSQNCYPYSTASEHYPSSSTCFPSFAYARHVFTYLIPTAADTCGLQNPRWPGAASIAHECQSSLPHKFLGLSPPLCQ